MSAPARSDVSTSTGRRRRRDDSSLVLICWRDIPAQVNAGSGSGKIPRILPRRFQRAIDRAAMVAGKTQASEYVGEWRRTVIPADGDDLEAAAIATAARLEEDFPRERLDRFVKTGGWDPDSNRDAQADSHPAPQHADSSGQAQDSAERTRRD